MRSIGFPVDPGRGGRVWLACGSSFVEDRIKVRGGQMKRRLILMLLVLATVLVAQDSAYVTNHETNGLGWRVMNEVGKVYFVMGTFSGVAIMENWALNDLPVCTDQITKSQYPQTTNGNLINEIDKFYQTPANVSLPVSVAVLYTYMKLNGATKAQLDQFRASALKAYVK